MINNYNLIMKWTLEKYVRRNVSVTKCKTDHCCSRLPKPKIGGTTNCPRGEEVREIWPQTCMTSWVPGCGILGEENGSSKIWWDFLVKVPSSSCRTISKPAPLWRQMYHGHGRCQHCEELEASTDMLPIIFQLLKEVQNHYENFKYI